MPALNGQNQLLDAYNYDLLEKYEGFFGENIFVSAVVGYE